mgnify:CR=1 FL=1|jgi:hypothetical protein
MIFEETQGEPTEVETPEVATEGTIPDGSEVETPEPVEVFSEEESEEVSE